MTWLSDFLISFSRSEWISFVGIIISATIAVLLYILGKRLNDLQRIDHITDVQNEVDVLLKNRDGRDIELYNSKMFTSRDFPKNKRSKLWGYSYHGAGLRGYTFEGVEFIVETVSWNKVNYYRAGIILYDRILRMKVHGDDSTNKPIFFVKPKVIQRDKYSIAYKRFVYYSVKEGLMVSPPLLYKINKTSKNMFLKARYHIYYRWRNK